MAPSFRRRSANRIDSDNLVATLLQCGSVISTEISWSPGDAARQRAGPASMWLRHFDGDQQYVRSGTMTYHRGFNVAPSFRRRSALNIILKTNIICLASMWLRHFDGDQEGNPGRLLVPFKLQCGSVISTEIRREEGVAGSPWRLRFNVAPSFRRRSGPRPARAPRRRRHASMWLRHFDGDQWSAPRGPGARRCPGFNVAPSFRRRSAMRLAFHVSDVHALQCGSVISTEIRAPEIYHA